MSRRLLQPKNRESHRSKVIGGAILAINDDKIQLNEEDAYCLIMNFHEISIKHAYLLGNNDR